MEHPLLCGRGTIPACAGSTILTPAVIIACGYMGPSPRARGALLPPVVHQPVQGTIPACAGSTPRHPRRAVERRDHPRVRGEHSN
jgi:hypothetical protein